MRHVSQKTLLLVVTILLAGAVFYWWQRGQPRRESLAALARLEETLRSADPAKVLDLVVVPSSVKGYNPAEQADFIIESLAGEISPEGLAVLRKHGQFGPLTELFPVESERWAQQAGVRAGDCVAFKLEQHGVRSEAVLAKTSALGPERGVYRILRINDVRQLALPPAVLKTELKP